MGKVIGTVAEGKKDVGAACGVDELIVLPEGAGTSYEDYEAVDVAARVKEVTGGEGCHAVIDGIGKNTLDISINSLAQRGIFVSFGNASGAVPAFPVLRLIGKSAFVCRPKLLDYTRTRAELDYRADQVFGWLKDGQLKVSVDATLPPISLLRGLPSSTVLSLFACSIEDWRRCSTPSPSPHRCQVSLLTGVG